MKKWQKKEKWDKRLHVTKNTLAEFKSTLKTIHTRKTKWKEHSVTFQGGLQINWKRPNTQCKVTINSI